MRRKTIPILTMFLLAAAAALAGPVNKTTFGGVAIKGYDPVAYFEENGPVKGSKDFEFEWQGATWRFASAANRDAFAGDPEAYAPQYGGFCAWAVSQGSTAGIDPDAWTLHDGKLYLNYNAEIQEKWLADRDALIGKADANWPALRDD